MNKLPWFTHDHDAHEDEFIQLSMDKFGPLGYSGYFITLELIHKHGCGGVLRMGSGRYAKHLRSRLDFVKKWLSFCGSYRNQSHDRSGVNPKIKYRFIATQFGEDIEIENKKFIERQRKLKSNAPSMLRERSVNAPLYIEGEGDVEKEHIPEVKPPIPDARAYEPKTDLDRIMCAYKISKGIKWDDRDWDKHNYKTWARAGRKLLEACGHVNDSIDFLAKFSETMKSKDLSWNMATAAKNAWDDSEVQNAKSNSRVAGKPGEVRKPSNGSNSGKVDANKKVPLSGASKTARVREEVGDSKQKPSEGDQESPGEQLGQSWDKPFDAD